MLLTADLLKASQNGSSIWLPQKPNVVRGSILSLAEMHQNQSKVETSIINWEYYYNSTKIIRRLLKSRGDVYSHVTSLDSGFVHGPS